MDTQVPTPTSREQLCALLAEAAEVEHHLMCSYLYAAFSLKTEVDEDLSEPELTAVRRWAREIVAVALEEMGHLTMVCNILSSLGAPAHLVHQNFPILPGFHPSGVVIRLAPFSPATIAHFVYMERPNGAAVPDGAGYEPTQVYARQLNMDRLMTVCTDYETVGQLYQSISAGLTDLATSLGEARLFVGNPVYQLDAETSQLPAVRTVKCLATALKCIEAIVLQGEGADTANEKSHYHRFLSIQSEYRELLSMRGEFQPTRSVAENPVMRPPPSPVGRIWIQEEPAACLLDLANALYNHCLRCLSLAYAGVDRATQRLLVRAGIDLMRLLTPVAQCLTQYPANRQHAGTTAGMSFATIRSSAALLAEVESVTILVERFEQIATRCRQLGSQHADLKELLDATALGAQRVADRLGAHHLGRATIDGESVAPAQEPPAIALTAPEDPRHEEVEIIAGPTIDIHYRGERCIHARHCVLGLPLVFKANVPGRWIDPAAASTEDVLTVAHMCPSGAIAYRRHDGGPEEQAPAVNLIQLRENGPLGVRAPVVLNGQSVGMRVVLCRCGHSQRKPFCDGSHTQASFHATGEPSTRESTPLNARDGILRVDTQANGPLEIEGNAEICTGTGRTVDRLTSVRLCRCGGSANKPYCDGSHRTNGFVG